MIYNSKQTVATVRHIIKDVFNREFKDFYDIFYNGFYLQGKTKDISLYQITVLADRLGCEPSDLVDVLLGKKEPAKLLEKFSTNFDADKFTS